MISMGTFSESMSSFKNTAAAANEAVWMIDPDTVVTRIMQTRSAAPNSSAKMRALHSIYYISFRPSNQKLMFNMGVVDLLAEELVTSDSNPRHLNLVLGALRNLSMAEETKLPSELQGVAR